MKSIRFNSATKLLAVLLAILMALSLFPVIAIAEDEKPVDIPAADADKTNQGLAFEVTDRREETVKHFRLSDGTYAAVQYDVPVHTLDADGMWQDIDNTLSDIGSEFSTSNARVKFAKKIPGNESLFTLHDGNAKVTVSLNGATKKTTGVVTNTHTELDENATELQKLMQLDKLSSRILYANILNGVDLEYVVEANNIKENIIVKERAESYSYTFTISLNNLSAELMEDGSVNLYDTETLETVYIIPKGFMVDADGDYSDSVSYTLVNKENGKYELTVISDATWMNAENRAFPVVIDPTIEYSNHDYSTTGIIDSTYINSTFPYQNFHGSSYTNLLVGTYYETYIKLNVPTGIPENAVVTNAILQLNVCSVTGGCVYVNLYKVTGAWDAATLTYNTRPGFNATAIDYCRIGGNTLFEWDVTSLAEQWRRSPSTNYGVRLAMSDSDGTSPCVTFRSERYGSGYTPCFIVTYKDTKGIEDYYSYYSSSADLAGNGQINAFTGNLCFIHSSLSTTDEILPYSVSLVYNSCLAGKEYASNNDVLTALTASPTGKGFKLSFDETICTYVVDNIYEDKYFVWADADGTEHYFSEYDYTWVEGDSTLSGYCDEDGLGLYLDEEYANEFSDEVIGYFIYDDAHNKKHFNAQGLLDYVEDANGNIRRFTRTNGRVTGISLEPKGSASFNQLTFSYSSATGRLTYATNVQSGMQARFYYSNTYNGAVSQQYSGYLRRITYTYPSGNTYSVSFEYDASGNLITAKDLKTGRAIAYGYGSGHKVISITEYVGATEASTLSSMTPGQSAQITYRTLSTEYLTSGNDNTFYTDDDLKTYYRFDAQGRVVTCYTSDNQTIYGASNSVYEGDDSVKTKNAISSVMQIGGTTVNYLLNPSFEDEDDDLPVNWTVDGDVSVWVNSYINPNENLVYMCLDEGSETATLSQEFIPYPGTYTASAVFFRDCMSVNSRARIVIKDADENEIAHSKEVIDYETGYSYGDVSETKSVTFTIPDRTTLSSLWTIEIEYYYEDNVWDGYAGIAVDSVMLERSSGAGKFSYIGNGGMENYQYSSVFGWYPKNAEAASVHLEGRQSIRVSGNPKNPGYARTEIHLNPSSYSASAQSFVLSGWAKANSAKTDYTLLEGSNTNTYHEPVYALKAVVHYLNSTLTTTTYIPFDDENTDWQFATGIIASATGLPISSVDVYCCYDYNLGYAYFDGISLVSNTNAVTSYSYNGYGYVSNVTSSDGNGIQYDRDNSIDVNTVASTNGRSLDFEYDANHRLIYETNTNGSNRFSITYNYDPDGTGQIESTVISSLRTGNLLTINSSVTHSTSAANFGAVLTETDECDRTTRYFYDSRARLTGMCDTDGKGVIYTYNGYGLVTAVREAVYNSATNTLSPASSPVTVTSVYNSNGSLASITNETSAYSFGYDTYGNLSSVTVNGSMLVEYQFKPNNGNVDYVQYGNGDSVKYGYDHVDRVTALWYNDVEGENDPVFTYSYNANGNLTSSTDYINQRSYIYSYDSSGRAVQTIVKDTADEDAVITVEQYVYDEQGRITGTYLNYMDNSAPPLSYYEYGYDGAGNVSELSYGGTGAKSYYSFDDFGRLQNEYVGTRSSDIFNKLYFYNDPSWNRTTYEVENLYIWDENGTEYDSFYEYYADGSIKSITVEDNGTVKEKYSYEYDRLGQLTRENIYLAAVSGKTQTLTYTYDKSGNILERRKYAYTEAASLAGQSYTSTAYGYEQDGTGSDVWNDLLTSYKGQSINYDESGNLVSYGSYSYTWTNGRQLASVYQFSPYLYTTYKYNDDGIRTEKNVSGIRHEYSVSGGQINREVIYASNNHDILKDIRYYYDAAGHPVAIKAYTRTSASADFTSNVYYLLTNMQGDVVAIYNDSGTKIFEYAYDAWGNILRSTQTATGGSAANAVNPFRYRGYYYDTETGLYYLQSRYYNPQWGRFLNADYAEVISDGSSLSDKNLFVYCDNNPVMRSDDNGEFWHIVAGAAIGAVVGGLSSIISQAVAGEDINWTAVAISAASGAISGAINAAVPCLGAIATGLVEGTLSAATYAATEKFAYGRDPSLSETLKTGLMSGITAGVGKEIAQSIGLCNCFSAGTLIAAETGYVTIENIKAGDLVWATDPETGETALKPVVQTFRNTTEEWIHVTVDGEELTCTPNHPFYSPVKGWTNACQLRAGDILVTLNGEYVVVEQIQHELLECPETTYNFEVEGFHTYYVGEEPVLVHNRGCGNNQGFNDDQQALLDLAKENKSGVTRGDANILVDWANDYGISNHSPQIHPGRGGYWSNVLHIKIKNIHIPVIGG